MKAILQRVASASVTVDTHLVSSIGKGVLVFAAVSPDDTFNEVESMASKVLKLRMWPDEAGGTWKRSVVDIAGEVLCVSQFTLLAQTKKGPKPDFHGAAGGDKARELYSHFVDKVKEIYQHEKVKDGVFQAMMQVELVNDGPVGVDYHCDDGEVTLEIQTNPPKKAEAKPDPSKDEKEEASKGFEMPAELLD